VAAAFDDQAQIVLACEIDSGDHVSGASGSHSVSARRGRPPIYPAGGLRRTGLIADIVGGLQVLDDFLAGCAFRSVRTGNERGLHLDETAIHILVQLLPAFGGRPLRVRRADAASEGFANLTAACVDVAERRQRTDRKGIAAKRLKKALLFV
jgi:hypothetical protein